MRAILASTLRRGAVEVTTARDASDALALLETHHFDAVVTDLVMPRIDGMQFVSQIRLRNRELPIIIVTGQPTLDTAISAVKESCFRYLSKPFDPDELCASVREAAALYRLATLKRHALEHFEAGQRPRSESTRLGEQFDEALTGLWMAFQPIVHWPSGSTYGYEALLRTVSGALDNPESVFDAAERLDRVHEIGRIIRRSVARAIDAAPGGVSIFVNLHATDLSDEDLFDPHSALANRARRVVLEVTERRSLDRIRDVPDRITRLRKLGYRIAVDDLGAGYAGLSSFTQLEPDVVKLDMSLIRDIDSSSRKASIVGSMIAVCTRDLGTRVVCEGVETEAERDVLVSLGADLLQGYLLGRPKRGF